MADYWDNTVFELQFQQSLHFQPFISELFERRMDENDPSLNRSNSWIGNFLNTSYYNGYGQMSVRSEL